MMPHTPTPIKNACSVLRWIDPKFANVTEPACVSHDFTYQSRAGNRICADLDWIAFSARLSGKPFRAMMYGAFVIMFGWWMWYNYDTKLTDAIKWVKTKARFWK